MSADALPAPLVPVDCDLQDFQFMPLDVARLRDSDLASDESPEACWAAVLLWAASWHQIPAGSIPDNEMWIAKQAGYAQRGKIAKEWSEVRKGALRGFVLCSDGRMYHAVVAEKALEAWQAKVDQRWRSECGRIKKHNQRHGTAHPIPDFVSWVAAGRPQGQHLSVPGDKTAGNQDNQGDTGSKRQGEGQGQGQGQGQGSIYSVPDGTGGKPPIPPPPPPPPKPPKVATPAEQEKSMLWGWFKTRLVEQGTSADIAAAGVLAGGLAKKYGNDVFIESARVAMASEPGNLHTYFVGLCETAVGKRPGLKRTVGLSDADRIAANAQADEEAKRLLFGAKTTGEVIDV